MTLESVLLTMFQRLHGERSAQAVYHILRGKRSGQTLQDVEYYQLKSFYSLLPNLPAVEFQHAIDRMVSDGLIRIKEQLVFLTENGERNHVDYGWRFNGWDYRGKEREFSKRLALVVQTLSNVRMGANMFMPIQRELPIQQFIKEFLRNQSVPISELSRKLRVELERTMLETQLTELQCTIFSYRLTGHGLTALTWEQLADELKVSSVSIQLTFLESLHIILDFIHEQEEFPLLNNLAVGCRVDTYLTHSAERTRKLFEHGYSIEQIASLRNLKISTIEDHFVEMAANLKHFPFEEFVSQKQMDDVWRHIDRLQTKRLRVLKEQCDELTYFQLRLIVIHGKQVSS
ncbi:helix-turn-helix domain-containing protein [Sporosarcina sp. GW1-11]|uniref:helix-turn-helix domain-containing protein n=1 Tax=Sporosarcina sp. GW1-11 TaxID=2899126 RepID=UPI00294E1DAF|nr:helix-turn-helix domain-containing protein [Sporosarcina sp. GW1-11]MDV6377652.1 helix-turn-helix domain-containing protein [Sporosarcina sp. GW1-11]